MLGLLDSKSESFLADLRAEKAARQKREAERRRTVREATEIRERCKTLAGFVREAWHVLEPVAVYQHNWHIDAICAHLEAVTRGEITRLLINVPPGSMKSLLVSVLWPAWEWAMGHASYRYITTSFAEDATTRDTRKMRDLVGSEWYRTLFPAIKLDRKGDTAISNTATGFRESSPFGSLTSKRGDRLIIDDPHSIKTAESEVQRNEVTRLFREGALNRLNDQKRSAIVVVMQRLHERDMSGIILEYGMDFVHLRLPMEFERENRCETVIGFRDPRGREGELLDPVRFPSEVVAQLAADMGSHAFAGQYQQRPSAREGGMFKRHWFQTVEAIPAEAKKRVRRWDLAASNPEPGSDPDWTVGLRMSTFDGKFYIEDVIRFRETANKVRRAIRAAASTDGRMCHIEIPQDPGQAGKDQAQSIIGENAGYVITAERETGAKDTRAEPLAAQVEAGNVYLLRDVWNESFIAELCAFPKGHDDQVDAASGAFNHLTGVQAPMKISDRFIQRAKIGGRVSRINRGRRMTSL